MPKQTDSIELTNSLQGTVEYTASQEIIPEEKILEQGSFTYTSNGERTENPSEGYDGFSNVAVNVNVQPTLQSKSVSYTENNDYTISPDDGYQGLSSVAVNVNVPQGPVEAPENDVEFIDYDGTIVYSYTAQEFLALDAMPANPTHEGLTAQGWNWSLADAKEYVTDVGGLVVGQMYITDDGKTRIYISLLEGYLSLKVSLNVAGTAHIAWGDGSDEDWQGNGLGSSASISHTYSQMGDYIIEFTPPSGDGERFRFSGTNAMSKIINHPTSTNNIVNTAYLNCVKKVEIGTGISNFGLYAFNKCGGLETITIPDTINSGTNTFSSAGNLRALVLPNEQFSGAQFANGCKNLTRVSVGKKAVFGTMAFNDCDIRKGVLTPDWAYNGDTAYYNNYHLKKIYIPKSFTSLAGNVVSGCYFLSKITVKENMTTIAVQALYNCVGLVEIRFEPTTPPTASSTNWWYNLPTTCKIYVPSGTLSAYTTETNYPSSSSYTYVEY